MLLNFYRYQYDQPRLAQEMDLGTCNNPNVLPYGEEHKVVDAIEKLSSNQLNATAIAKPTWNTYQIEIQANRPFISLIPAHSRTVIGYHEHMLEIPGHLPPGPPPRMVPIKLLLVYDPWPPTDCAHREAGGVITWENFITQTYRYAFTVVLNHV
jgi:hypothetical protein